jgi:putative SOS response-associated peptidase YedK
MCGRYSLEYDDEQYVKRYDLVNDLKGYKSSWNVRPETEQPVILTHSPNHVELMKWGYIPSFAEHQPKPLHLINVKFEGLSKGWVHKDFQFNRCIIGVSGFYEPKGEKGTKNRPQYYFSVKGEKYFSLAGIYREAKDSKGQTEKRFAIITIPPGDIVGKVHDRSPWILNKEDEETYLNPDNAEVEELFKLQRPFKGDLQSWPVSLRVNQWGQDDPDLIKPEK